MRLMITCRRFPLALSQASCDQSTAGLMVGRPTSDEPPLGAGVVRGGRPRPPPRPPSQFRNFRIVPPGSMVSQPTPWQSGLPPPPVPDPPPPPPLPPPPVEIVVWKPEGST